MSDKTRIAELENQVRVLRHTAKNNPTLSKKEKKMAMEAADKRAKEVEAMKAKADKSAGIQRNKP